jgi:alkylation response protein AidB-like acyl-CoA dehydrogenase
VTRRDLYGRPWSKEMLAKFSAARSFAADVAELVTSRSMELMGSYGYAFGGHIEKYARDFKIVKMWLGGAQRDRLEVAQGLYGPFSWPGSEA